MIHLQRISEYEIAMIKLKEEYGKKYRTKKWHEKYGIKNGMKKMA